MADIVDVVPTMMNGRANPPKLNKVAPIAGPMLNKTSVINDPLGQTRQLQSLLHLKIVLF